MKFKCIVAALLALAAASSEATVYQYTTDAQANATVGIPGASATGTHLFLTAGEEFTVSTDPSQIWHAAAPWDWNYWNYTGNADGEAWFAQRNLPGAGGDIYVGIGALVADVGGIYQFIGAGTHTFSAPTSGELLFHFADWNNYDNSGVVNSTVTVNDVPEPGSIALLGLGLAGFAAFGRRKRG